MGSARALGDALEQNEARGRGLRASHPFEFKYTKKKNQTHLFLCRLGGTRNNVLIVQGRYLAPQKPALIIVLISHRLNEKPARQFV